MHPQVQEMEMLLLIRGRRALLLHQWLVKLKLLLPRSNSMRQTQMGRKEFSHLMNGKQYMKIQVKAKRN